MGQSESKPDRREVPIEQLSHELALSFASKCFSHLEIAHFKDNFKRLAEHQDNLEFWREETLCRFLGLPDSIRAGSVLYAMATYLGAFPFPSLAPCIVTREAMLKVITILTGRYRKVLKRGDHDKNKLIFRSLAVFDRRTSMKSPTLEKRMEDLVAEQKASDDVAAVQTASTGFSIDQPVDEDEDEDDDDLALAALDALDAIEVFKHEPKKDRKINHAHIPMYNFERIIMLLLFCASLTPQDEIALLMDPSDEATLASLEASARSLIAAFSPTQDNISYSAFIETMTVLTPNLFRPLNPLFEHFLFSKSMTGASKSLPGISPIAAGDLAPSSILNHAHLAQLSMSFDITQTTSPAASSFFHTGARFNRLYSTSQDGTSLSSLSRQILSWKSANFLLLRGTSQTGTMHVIGAYVPQPWKENGTQDIDTTAVMFQLHPRHAMFRANPYNKTIPISHYSSHVGISLGCVIPAASRINASSQRPILGPVSLVVDEDMSSVTFQHDSNAGTGAFLTDPLLEQNQKSHPDMHPKKLELELDEMEVWGVSFPAEGEDAITQQKRQLAWEEAEAARRRGVNFGGDKDGARHLLEMAGIVSENNRSGGSV